MYTIAKLDVSHTLTLMEQLCVKGTINRARPTISNLTELIIIIEIRYKNILVDNLNWQHSQNKIMCATLNYHISQKVGIARVLIIIL